MRAHLHFSEGPSWREVAVPAAAIGALTHPGERALAASALSALGVQPKPGRVACFLLSRWYAMAADAALALQADRLSPDWVANNVPLAGDPLPTNSIFISVHHACHFLAMQRLATLLPDVALVSSINRANRPNTRRAELLLDLVDRTFGTRVYSPRSAARSCLDLLRYGGSVLLFCDFVERAAPVPLFGRQVPVAPGPTWFAQKTGRPIVPVMIVPNRTGWGLWCGEPITRTEHGLEACIRRAPASWLGWWDWLHVGD